MCSIFKRGRGGRSPLPTRLYIYIYIQYVSKLGGLSIIEISYNTSHSELYCGLVKLPTIFRCKGPFKYYVSHRGGGRGSVKCLHWLTGGRGDQQKYYMLTEGGVRQMLTHLKCCTRVHMTARGNACALKVVKSWLKPL